jgi:O-antigen/teichoic acid export membrane protein
MKSDQVSLPLFGRAFSTLRSHLRIPLYANAYALMTNQVLAAGLGFLFWLMAARLYSVDVVGENSAIISTILFMSALAELSFKSAMTRFVPRAGKNTPRLIGSVFGINLGASFLISLFLVTVGKHLPLISDLLETVDIVPVWLILATMAISISYIQDGVLIGMRQSKWVLIKNISLSVIKLILLVAFFRLFTEYGIVTSFFVTVPFLVLLFLYLIYYRFMQKHVTLDIARTKPITRRELFGSITGDHIGTILSETCVRLLPLLVLHLLGASFTAYYYQTWNITSTLYLLATSMTASFTVEASANMTQLVLNSRRILRQMASLLIPVVLVLWFGAPLILHLLGSNYALESLGLMRWLLAATLPYMITSWYLSYARVLAKVKTIILIQGIQLVVTLAASYLLIPRYGIIGVGIAWLLAHSIITILAIPKLAQMFLSKNLQHAGEKISPNQMLRRADWRFLLPQASLRKSVCFSDGLIASSVASVSEQIANNSDPTSHDCDLAVTINPNRSILRKANEALRPDGICYSEWSAWRVGGKRGIRNRLQKSGFTWVKYYCAVPSPVRPRIWFALQSNKAPYRYIAQQIFPADNLIHRAGRAMITSVIPVFVRAGLVPYVSTVAGRGTPQKQDVFEIIQQQWPGFSPEIRPSKLSFLMQTSGSLLSNNVIYLVFAETDEYPRWVIKIPRLPRDAVTLQHEKEVLMDLRKFDEMGSKDLIVPQFVLDPISENMQIYGQSALRGKSLSKLLHNGQFRRIATQMTDAQIALADHSKNELHLASSGEFVQQILIGLDEFVDETLDSKDIVQTRELLSSLETIPSTYAHNDFAVWNMVATPGGLGVFDWSDADRLGLPLLDLVYGLSGAVFLMENAHSAEQRKESYLRLLDPDTPAGRIFQDCLARYASEVGLNPDRIPPLRLMTWVLHSTYERNNHQLALDDSTSTLESLCTPLWKAELQIQQAGPDMKHSG